MRIIFMGTPEFAVPALYSLHAAEHEIVAVYTQPPRPGGRRGKELTPTPVHKAADALGLPVRHPVSLRTPEVQAKLAALDADVAVVAAYGLILPQAVLDMPRHGCLNIHGSLLPRWRGAAPVQRAILAGDEATGITIMQMEAGLDTGPMLAREATPIDHKTTGELTAELAAIGARLMTEVLGDLSSYPPVAQDDALATYAAKIDKAEARLDFGKSAVQLEREIRAFAPSPGAWFELNGERFRVLAAELAEDTGIDAHDQGCAMDDRLTIACGDGAIRPTLIQRAGRPVMEVETLLRGMPIAPGTSLN